MEWIFTILKWIAYVLLGLFALIALGFVIELIYRVWRQVILGEVYLDVDQLDFCDAANDILDRKEKVDVGTWLKGAEYEAVAREVKRRYQQYTDIERLARRLTGADRARIIQLQVEGCLAELVGGSGDLGQLILEEGSFRIEGEQPLDYGGVEVAFSASAWRESERLAPGDDAPIPVRGRLWLDGALRTRAGPDGKTALAPERTTVAPGTWASGARQALYEIHARELKGPGSIMEVK